MSHYRCSEYETAVAFRDTKTSKCDTILHNHCVFMYTSIHLTTYAHDYRVLEVFENVPNWVHNIGTEEWGVYVVIEARAYLSPIIIIWKFESVETCAADSGFIIARAHNNANNSHSQWRSGSRARPRPWNWNWLIWHGTKVVTRPTWNHALNPCWRQGAKEFALKGIDLMAYLQVAVIPSYIATYSFRLPFNTHQQLAKDALSHSTRLWSTWSMATRPISCLVHPSCLVLLQVILMCGRVCAPGEFVCAFSLFSCCGSCFGEPRKYTVATWWC